MQNINLMAADRTLEIKYAIRDIIVVADEVAKTGKELLYLNIGDPNVYDHSTPDHVIEAVYKAMKDNKNGYSASSGIKEGTDAIRREAERKGNIPIASCKGAAATGAGLEGIMAGTVAARPSR